MKNLLPGTATRIRKHTKKSVNSDINRETISNIARFVGKDRKLITKRIEQLDMEWDIERTLELNASAIIVVSTLLGFFANRWWLVLTFAVGAFLMQHALQGWCPPLPIFRRMGIRTASEIDQEKVALKYIRGDFDSYTVNPEELSRRSE